MSNKYSWQVPFTAEELAADYRGGMSQVEIAAKWKVSQKVVWRAMLKFGIPRRTAAKRDQRGPKNSTWRGGATRSRAGYVFVQCKGHPRASDCGGYVQLHVLVVEQHLGRLLAWYGPGHPKTEIVHHKNGDRTDNRFENLEVLSHAEHMSLHNRLRREARLCQRH